MKSMSRGCAEPAAVTSTMLSPQRMTTEPLACLAHLPVSMVISLPPTMAVSRTNAIDVSFRLKSRRRPLVSWPEPSVQSLELLRGARLNDQTSATLEFQRRYGLLPGRVLHTQLPKAKALDVASRPRPALVSGAGRASRSASCSDRGSCASGSRAARGAEPTIFRRPRRLWWSLWLFFRCSVRCEMRSVSSATWTSGEPVSPWCCWNLPMVSCLRTVETRHWLLQSPTAASEMRRVPWSGRRLG